MYKIIPIIIITLLIPERAIARERLFKLPRIGSWRQLGRSHSTVIIQINATIIHSTTSSILKVPTNHATIVPSVIADTLGFLNVDVLIVESSGILIHSLTGIHSLIHAHPLIHAHSLIHTHIGGGRFLLLGKWAVVVHSSIVYNAFEPALSQVRLRGAPIKIAILIHSPRRGRIEHIIVGSHDIILWTWARPTW